MFKGIFQKGVYGWLPLNGFSKAFKRSLVISTAGLGVIFTAGLGVIFTAGLGVIFAAGLGVIFTAGRGVIFTAGLGICLLYTSPSPRDQRGSRMPSSA